MSIATLNPVDRVIALVGGVKALLAALQQRGISVSTDEIQRWSRDGRFPENARESIAKITDAAAQEIKASVNADSAPTVVDRAIALVGGRPIELARRLKEQLGRDITRQVIHGWKLRGIFPREFISPINRITDIPIDELLNATPRRHGSNNIVQHVVDRFGDGSATKLAELLSKQAKRKCTRQMVANWLVAEQFPRLWVLDIHQLTRIRIEKLMKGRLEKKIKQGR